MSENLPFISVVLPVYNEEKYLERCLLALREVNYPRHRYEIITVDNGSSDNSFSIAQRLSDKALFYPECNVGAVRNYGVSKSIGTIIAFLDSDCLVSRDWLTNGLRNVLNQPDSIHGGVLFLSKNPTWIERYWLLDDCNKNSSQNDLLGSCIFIQKKHFIAVSGFNEQMTSGEDSHLSLKLRKKGYSVVIDSNLGVVHMGNATTIKSFLVRQIWHAENYIQQFKVSFRDLTFLFICLYIITIISLLLSFFVSPRIFFLSLLLLIMIPVMFSAKRIKRSNNKNIKLTDIPIIYFIDNLYLMGRSIGLTKSIIKSINLKYK